MPRKYRVSKRRRDAGTIRASVVVFLETGELAAVEAENPWLALSLLHSAAEDARIAWREGDAAGARAHLLRCVGGRHLFG